MSGERWATFDCYGTLVDWDSGTKAGLRVALGDDSGFERFRELERELQSERPDERYREVMALAVERLARESGVELDPGGRDVLGETLPGWPVFPDVAPGLTELRASGFALAILSNTDRDFIEASMEAIGVPFELAIVASEIGSYKPAHGHWRAFYDQTGADPAGHVHVAASLFHDVGPCNELGIPCVWINRTGEPAGDARPAAELKDLGGLSRAADRALDTRT